MNMLSTQPQIELLDRRPEHFRRAVSNDMPALTALIDRSMRELGTEGYSQRQITSSLLYLTQVDPRLITDGTYFVAEADSEIVGAGGWTRRVLAHGAVRREHAAGYEQWLEFDRRCGQHPGSLRRSTLGTPEHRKAHGESVRARRAPRRLQRACAARQRGRRPAVSGLRVHHPRAVRCHPAGWNVRADGSDEQTNPRINPRAKEPKPL